jgi:hypothetical protein
MDRSRPKEGHKRSLKGRKMMAHERTKGAKEMPKME